MQRSFGVTALAAGLLVCLSGCGSSSSSVQADARAPHSVSPTSPGKTMANGMTMSPGMTMSGTNGPSAAARMICGQEIGRAVQRQFGLPGLPQSSSSWSNRLYSCTYRLPQGPLLLSVKDSTDTAVGHSFFEKAMRQSRQATPIRGLQSFGLPSYETPTGAVAFLRDGKTLVVDASRLASVPGSGGHARTDAAYAIAASVVACWTE